MGNEDIQKLLTVSGISSGAGGLNAWSIMGYIIFGVIGTVAFMYGKKEKQYKALGLGLVISIYPYFVGSNTVLLYIIGIILTALLFIWRD